MWSTSNWTSKPTSAATTRASIALNLTAQKLLMQTTIRIIDFLTCAVQVHKLEASLRGQKEALEVEVRGTAGQADVLREQVGQLRNQASHSLAASEEKLRSMHAQYDDLAR